MHLCFYILFRFEWNIASKYPHFEHTNSLVIINRLPSTIRIKTANKAKEGAILITSIFVNRIFD